MCPSGIIPWSAASNQATFKWVSVAYLHTHGAAHARCEPNGHNIFFDSVGDVTSHVRCEMSYYSRFSEKHIIVDRRMSTTGASSTLSNEISTHQLSVRSRAGISYVYTCYLTTIAC